MAPDRVLFVAGKIAVTDQELPLPKNYKILPLPSHPRFAQSEQLMASISPDEK
jgi:hypothetical protein